MGFVLFIIAISASTIGSICGIGGGIIIKPVLDMFRIADVSAISFISGCTVLSMALYNVGNNMLKKSGSIDISTGTPLAIGAALGGIIGNVLFTLVKDLLGSNLAGSIQSVCLMVLTIGTVIYSLKKERIQTKSVSAITSCIIIGFSLGIMSSFLGIGGGPFNLVILNYFFGMGTKKAASNSLYIILFSQMANLLITIIRHSVPSFDMLQFTLMICGGISGGILGKHINKLVDDKTVDRLFMCLLFTIIVICLYNTYKYMVL